MDNNMTEVFIATGQVGLFGQPTCKLCTSFEGAEQPGTSWGLKVSEHRASEQEGSRQSSCTDELPVRLLTERVLTDIASRTCS